MCPCQGGGGSLISLPRGYDLCVYIYTHMVASRKGTGGAFCGQIHTWLTIRYSNFKCVSSMSISDIRIQMQVCHAQVVQGPGRGPKGDHHDGGRGWLVSQVHGWVPVGCSLLCVVILVCACEHRVAQSSMWIVVAEHHHGGRAGMAPSIRPWAGGQWLVHSGVVPVETGPAMTASLHWREGTPWQPVL